MTTNLDARLQAPTLSPVLSIFRIVFGLLFTLHGTMKLFGWPLGTSIPVGTWPQWWAGLIGVRCRPADIGRIVHPHRGFHRIGSYGGGALEAPSQASGPSAVRLRGERRRAGDPVLLRLPAVGSPPAPAPFRWMPGDAARWRLPPLAEVSAACGAEGKIQVVHYARPDAVRLPRSARPPKSPRTKSIMKKPGSPPVGRRRRRTGTGGDGRPQRRRLPRSPQGHLRHERPESRPPSTPATRSAMTSSRDGRQLIIGKPQVG